MPDMELESLRRRGVRFLEGGREKGVRTNPRTSAPWLRTCEGSGGEAGSPDDDRRL